MGSLKHLTDITVSAKIQARIQFIGVTSEMSNETLGKRSLRRNALLVEVAEIYRA